MNKTFRLMFIFILGGLLVCGASAQTTSPLNLSVSLDNPVLERRHVPIVHVKIKWGPVPDAKPATLRAVQITLVKPGIKLYRCPRADCIGATFSLPNELTPRAGESVEFDIALNDLYWNDVIASQIDLSEPKNLFEVVPAGSYALSLSLAFRANYSTKGEPRVVRVESNSVTVEIRP